MFKDAISLGEFGTRLGVALLSSDVPSRRTRRVVAFLVVAMLGAIHTAARRWSMNPDGVGYLDIADLYRAGDWNAAINGTWSPAFSWVLAAVLSVTDPSPAIEYTVVHVVIYAMYLLAFVAFDWMLERMTPAPRPLIWDVTACSIFLWATLSLVDLKEVTPDIGALALTFLIAGIAQQLNSNTGSVYRWALLGGLVAAAYLIKAVFLYVGVALIILLALSQRSVRPIASVATSLLTFALVAGPWIAALSLAKGRFTTGDVGPMAASWFYSDVTPVQHWQGLPEGSGVPVHPTRQILAHPHVYEFATPVPGTHPPRTEPSYWYEGVKVTVRPARILRIVITSAQNVGWVFVPLLFTVACLTSHKGYPRILMTRWPLGAAMLLGVSLFFVLYTETRYISGFVVVLFLLAFSAHFQHPRPEVTRRSLLLVATAVAIVCMLPVASSSMYRLREAISLPSENPYWSIARGLRQHNVPLGAQIAIIGHAPDAASWARLGGYKIVAEVPVPQDQTFWSCDSAQRDFVLGTLAASGAVAIVAETVPAYVNAIDWVQLGPGGPSLAPKREGRPHDVAPSNSPSFLDYRDVQPCRPVLL